MGEAQALKPHDPPGGITPAERLSRQAQQAIARLEKLTPDLRLAHHASGLRRTLLRLTREQPAQMLDPQAERLLRETLAQSERLLIRAAREKMRRSAHDRPS